MAPPARHDLHDTASPRVTFPDGRAKGSVSRARAELGDREVGARVVDTGHRCDPTVLDVRRKGPDHTAPSNMRATCITY
ncbi:hypothetical protein GCM10010345_67580 [Streptomyces canarius]|uniref:Uncharacterized protein n=1 Tax=Streptomyces canarius TaxID=285453 RepID=A0ABQ3D783_9ACTN|nr:hypothetical protein GCM10010345_67580 [Streptomyces canarius]